MIDIVIPYYNDHDEEWKKVLIEYMQKENSTDTQVIGDERYRDWDCFKYWFRCVEKNCKWVNKVFLLVASETQVPEWLDVSNPKLKVVLHKEFIPKELLPTFNTMTIEMYIPRIKDLSDNYIYCNDDYYFLNPTTAGMFFVDNYPVYRDNAEKLVKFGAYWLESVDGTFYDILNNCIDLQKEICGDKAHWYAVEHLPVAHKKNFENEIIDKYYDRFIKANSTSGFRSKDKYCNHLYRCLYKDLKPYYKFNSYHNSYYVTIKKDINFEEHGHCDMICLNDTEQLKKEDFENVKKRMIEFFEKRFPDKSSFEK